MSMMKGFFWIIFAVVIFGFAYNAYNAVNGRLCEYDMFQPGQPPARVKVRYQYNCMPYQHRSVVYTNGKEVK